MTDGEKMIWAAAYVAKFVEETALQHRPRDSWGGSEAANARLDEWGTHCAILAIETATTAVRSLRDASSRVLDENDATAQDMYKQMVH